MNLKIEEIFSSNINQFLMKLHSCINILEIWNLSNKLFFWLAEKRLRLKLKATIKLLFNLL